MDENNKERTPSPPKTPSRDVVFTNELTHLGNQAVKMGLISGHGYHQGKYEILFNGQLFRLTPEEAHTYLKNLLKQHQR